MKRKPLVSIIIPALNADKFLDSTLKSVRAQTYRNIEIVVVAGGSSDKVEKNTHRIVKKYQGRYLKYGLERSEKMNYGINKARGKYCYRIDADFVLEPGVVDQCVKKCENEGFDGVAVHNTSAEGLGFWSDVRKLERNCYRDDDLVVGVRFFSKKAAQKIGGFDENLFGPEDYDFHNRFLKAGFKYGRVEAIERHLGEPRTLKYIFEKSYLYGQEMTRYFRKDPKKNIRHLNPVRKAFFRHWRDFACHPVLALGFIVMWLVKFVGGGLGMIKAYSTGFRRKYKHVKAH